MYGNRWKKKVQPRLQLGFGTSSLENNVETITRAKVGTMWPMFSQHQLK